MLGNINVVEQIELTKMPQKAASAWSAFESEGLVGAGYKPFAYVGSQVVKGVNHVFLAEQTLITNPPERHIVAITINEFQGNYKRVAIAKLY